MSTLTKNYSFPSFRNREWQQKIITILVYLHSLRMDQMDQNQTKITHKKRVGVIMRI